MIKLNQRHFKIDSDPSSMLLESQVKFFTIVLLIKHRNDDDLKQSYTRNIHTFCQEND